AAAVFCSRDGRHGYLHTGRGVLVQGADAREFADIDSGFDDVLTHGLDAGLLDLSRHQVTAPGQSVLLARNTAAVFPVIRIRLSNNADTCRGASDELSGSRSLLRPSAKEYFPERCRDGERMAVVAGAGFVCRADNLRSDALVSENPAVEKNPPETW